MVEFQELNHIQWQIDNAYHEAAVKMGLSDSEMWILYILSASGNSCLESVMRKETCMIKTTVNSSLKKMEREGFLRLEPGEGRNVRVILTDEGEELAKRTAWRLIEAENRIYESWTPEEREMLERLNRSFAEKLKKEVQRL